MNSISILGCGWLGLPLGKSLVQQGYTVLGSTTRVEKLPIIQAAGMEALVVNVGETISGKNLDRFFQSEVLIVNIPPGRRRAAVEQQYPQEIRLIGSAAKKHGVKKILFISSTGVYPANGQIVNEEDEVAPASASGRALVAAERYVQNEKAWTATVLRLAGLIGGERHPGRWFAGKKDLEGGSIPINLVHLEDCILAISAIIQQEQWGKIYQLCADEHPLKKEYYPLMAAQLGLEVPTYAEDENSTKPFKIVANEKIKRELALVLRYPDPRKT